MYFTGKMKQRKNISSKHLTNLVMISIEKPLLSRMVFFPKKVRGYLFPHLCGNYGNSISQLIFWQKNRESNGFTKEITKYLIDLTIFFNESNFSTLLCAHSVEIRKFFPHEFFAKISSK